MGSSANANCIDNGCVLVWADEFDGSAVDTGKWEFMIGNGGLYNLPGWGNNELQYYRSENATVVNGELTITAREQSFGGFNYTSSRLRTKGLGDWKYGRFEMRAKLPSGQGFWPAFWMLPTDNVYGIWAASGEIDIMEQIGSEPDRILGSLHYGGESPGNVYTTSVYNLAPGEGSNYHVYAVEWEDGEVRWYIDGILYGTRTQWWSAGGPFPAPFDQQFHLLLNLAVGGNLPGNPDGSTPFPAEYVIDYVRVYQLPANLLPPKRVFDDMEHGNPFANGWFIFTGIGGGGLAGNFSDLPPDNAGNASLQTGWGSGGTPGYFGGFGRTRPMSLADMTEFRFWINPDAGQDYVLGINLQEDDNGDGGITNGDDEFQYDCVISPSGPCAIAGGGWQLVSIPLDDFFDDNSVFTGGNGLLDAVPVSAGGNGELINVVAAIVSNTGADVSFRSDYWTFYGELADVDGDGVPDLADNCTGLANADQYDSNGDQIGSLCDADVTGPGGVEDCTVNFLDLQVVKDAFFSNPASPAWDPDADFDNSGLINFADLQILKDQIFGPPGPSAAGCN